MRYIFPLPTSHQKMMKFSTIYSMQACLYFSNLSISMANLLQSATIFHFLLAFFIISGGLLKTANGQAAGQGSWCIALPSASDHSLMGNIDFACQMVDCSIIQPGGDCFIPNDVRNHASVVMNLYYQQHGKNRWDCEFSHSGTIVVTDPSWGNCKYKYVY